MEKLQAIILQFRSVLQRRDVEVDDKVEHQLVEVVNHDQSTRVKRDPHSVDQVDSDRLDSVSQLSADVPVIGETFDPLVERLVVYDHIERDYEQHHEVEDVQHELDGHPDFVGINRDLKHALDGVLNHGQDDDLLDVEAVKLVAADFESGEDDQKIKEQKGLLDCLRGDLEAGQVFGKHLVEPGTLFQFVQSYRAIRLLENDRDNEEFLRWVSPKLVLAFDESNGENHKQPPKENQNVVAYDIEPFIGACVMIFRHILCFHIIQILDELK